MTEHTFTPINMPRRHITPRAVRNNDPAKRRKTRRANAAAVIPANATQLVESLVNGMTRHRPSWAVLDKCDNTPCTCVAHRTVTDDGKIKQRACNSVHALSPSLVPVGWSATIVIGSGNRRGELNRDAAHLIKEAMNI